MKMGKPLRLPKYHCLNCLREADGASQVSENPDDDGPSPGDITICIYCGHIMAFADDLVFRELTGKEVIMIAGDKRILAMLEARGELFKRKNQS